MLIVFGLYLIVPKILFEKDLKKKEIKQNRKENKKKEKKTSRTPTPRPEAQPDRPARALRYPPLSAADRRAPFPPLTAKWDLPKWRLPLPLPCS